MDPVILESPASLTVATGSDVSLTCVYSGTPKPYFFWNKDDEVCFLINLKKLLSHFYALSRTSAEKVTHSSAFFSDLIYLLLIPPK